MSSLDVLMRLRRCNEALQASDPAVSEEARDLANNQLLEAAPGRIEDVDAAVNEESIVLRRQRPVLAILDDVPQLKFKEKEDSTLWKKRLEDAQEPLIRAIRAVGRINLSGGDLDWVGTGWLVWDGILVSNRHVARAFSRASGRDFTFTMTPSIDFLEEIDNERHIIFKIERTLHIEDESGPDMAFFEVSLQSGENRLAQRVDLSSAVKVTENVAVIGYPAYDSRIPDVDLMRDIYGNVFNKKRLAPGAVTKIEEARLLHNCTTLGGNSGSVVVDLDSGKAIGLHFSGSFLTTNYAVRSDVVAARLARVRQSKVRPELPRPLPAPPPTRNVAAATTMVLTTSLNLPLKLSIRVELDGDALQGWSKATRHQPSESNDWIASAEDEAKPADYSDRTGYREDFIGARFRIPMPEPIDGADMLSYDNQGRTDHVLRYEHFSVIMSESRRMCFLSAVNINGKLSRKTKRAPWRWDPRISKSQQVMQECYGNPPRFSRGHMTRREDPAWGDEATAELGNQDSMHVTNVTPQMQAFNAPVWLGLEDYALRHAQADDMKISVFTGPYFSEDDPTRNGVLIPRAFWKVIAFVHDDTGELCATGYEMNQESTLQDEEFVFGQYDSPQLGTATQVSLRSIQERGGINFGDLVLCDPLSGAESFGGDEGVPLQRQEDIRFVG